MPIFGIYYYLKDTEYKLNFKIKIPSIPNKERTTIYKVASCRLNVYRRSTIFQMIPFMAKNFFQLLLFPILCSLVWITKCCGSLFQNVAGFQDSVTCDLPPLSIYKWQKKKIVPDSTTIHQLFKNLSKILRNKVQSKWNRVQLLD